jgi:hypothetical protein
MAGFKCSRCGEAATHVSPLTGTNAVPTNVYRCPKYKGRAFSPIPGVRWVPSKFRRKPSGVGLRIGHRDGGLNFGRY